MTKNIRTFGVNDPDQYWRDRSAKNRTSEKRVHRFIYDLCSEIAATGSNVLVCGVGDGHEYRLCARDHTTYGVEWSGAAIRGYDFSTDRIVQADLNEGIPDFPVQFDAITISMVLHWLDDPEGFLRASKGHLEENGGLVVIIPNITHYRFRLDYLFGRFPPISPSHRNFQTPTECEAMVEETGCQLATGGGTSDGRPNLVAMQAG